jgi:hypothetical protein
MKQRKLFSGIGLIALFSWGGLFLFMYNVPPSTHLALLAFFGLLAVALMLTFSPLAYLIGQRLLFTRRYRSTVSQALRQGALLTFIITANLALRLLHSWNLLTTFIIIAAAIIIEVLSLARKA